MSFVMIVSPRPIGRKPMRSKSRPQPSRVWPTNMMRRRRAARWLNAGGNVVLTNTTSPQPPTSAFAAIRSTKSDSFAMPTLMVPIPATERRQGRSQAASGQQLRRRACAGEAVRVLDGGQNRVGDTNPIATAADIGLRRDQIHEARQLRDANAAGSAPKLPATERRQSHI